MKKVIAFSIPFILFLACNYQNGKESSANKKLEIQRTTVDIRGNQFFINEELTYKGRFWMGNKIEGLLLNSRMVQGIFDDYNEETRKKWKYPDTQKFPEPFASSIKALQFYSPSRICPYMWLLHWLKTDSLWYLQLFSGSQILGLYFYPYRSDCYRREKK